MCSKSSGLDDEDSAQLMPTEEPLREVTICRKCKEKDSVVVLQSKFPYCRECFIEVVSHKFFGSLGKSKIMRPSDRVLVLCSGSQSSSALLNLVRIGLHERHKRILSEALVLFIDGGCFLPLSAKERCNLVKEIREMVNHFGFKGYYSPLVISGNKLMPLEDISWCTEEYMESTSCQSLAENIRTQTAKEDLLAKMRSLVSSQAARELGCSKVFSGETNDHTAARILTNVALGRGDQLPLDIGFADKRFEGVVTLRPLRECSKKEISLYCHFFNLPFVTYLKGGSLKGDGDSIQKLTEKFVAELQVSYPSTVCSVVGTGNKLGLVKTELNSQLACPLCQGESGSGEEEVSAVSATKVSRLISTLGPCGFESASLAPDSLALAQRKACQESACGDNCCSSKNKIIGLSQQRDAFCYGCQLILNDMESIDSLPKEILCSAQHVNTLKSMKHEIKDFLL